MPEGEEDPLAPFGPLGIHVDHRPELEEKVVPDFDVSGRSTINPSGRCQRIAVRVLATDQMPQMQAKIETEVRPLPHLSPDNTIRHREGQTTPFIGPIVCKSPSD